MIKRLEDNKQLSWKAQRLCRLMGRVILGVLRKESMWQRIRRFELKSKSCDVLSQYNLQQPLDV